MLVGSTARADEYSDTVNVYKNAGDSAAFFKNSYAYAVFPTIAKGGLGVGAAHGTRISTKAFLGWISSSTTSDNSC